MAVRLQMKLGVVAEHDRLPDSPDTLVVVEPNVGSVARSKGLLYLLVTSRISSRHALEATRLAAETIRNEYYYDESAGIRVCLQKAIGTANKRLAHQADRLGLKSTDANGPIGVAVAVVRGNEMYVATVGPAEAYLIRQARLSTLPDPHRERGLPSGELEPDVWRGEVSVGDSLVLVSPNVMAKLGPDELKDAMLTLHPQSAMEHLHHRFVAGRRRRQRRRDRLRGGRGLGHGPRTRAGPGQAGRAARRRARPLADPACRQRPGGGRARSAPPPAVPGWRPAARFEKVVGRVQELMPRRKPAYRRVTPLASRRQTQRRAALAVLALLVVAAGLGLRGLRLRRARASRRPSSSVNAGQDGARHGPGEPRQGQGPGRRPRRGRPRAGQGAPDRGVPAAGRGRGVPSVSVAVIEPLRKQAVAGLDRLYGVVPVASTTLFTFTPAEGGDPIDLRRPGQGTGRRAVRPGPLDQDRLPRRPQVQEGHGRRPLRDRRPATRPSRRRASWRSAAPDLLILDSKNTLWRWRPSNATRQGHAHQASRSTARPRGATT